MELVGREEGEGRICRGFAGFVRLRRRVGWLGGQVGALEGDGSFGKRFQASRSSQLGTIEYTGSGLKVCHGCDDDDASGDGRCDRMRGDCSCFEYVNNVIWCDGDVEVRAMRSLWSVLTSGQEG